MSARPADPPGHAEPPDLVHRIDGRRVRLPLQVADCRCGVALLTASARRLEGLLPDGLEPMVWRPGRGLVLLVMVDYRDNPLGDYDEVVVASAVHPVGTGGAGRPQPGPVRRLRDVLRRRFGVYVHHMPVDQPFTREAGEAIWGYPKTLDPLALSVGGRRAGVRWSRDGRLVLELSVPRGGRLPVPPSVGTTYSLKDGRLHRTRFTARGRGARFGPGGARLTLGHGGVADELRSLRLSRAAVATAWVEHGRMRFEAASPVGPGRAPAAAG